MAFLEVFSDDRSIYAIAGGGSLVWYRDLLRDGTNGPNGQRGWAPQSGSQIGRGWDAFIQVVAGGNGILYAIRGTGELLWYRDTLRDGTNGPNAERGWAAGSGSQIGAGWHTFRFVFSGGNGVIYAIRETGELLWYRDTLRNGTNGPNAERGWAAGSGSQIGAGWGQFDAVFSPGTGDGIMYAIRPTSDLLWYRDTLGNGTNGANGERGWAPGSGSAIGLGWSIEPHTIVTGYASPLSAGPGQTVRIKLSAREPLPCTVQILRLRENPDGTVGVPVGAAVRTVTPSRQPVPSTAWQSGCGWTTTVNVPVGSGWPSGLYSARVAVTGGAGGTDVVFVVRPGATRRPFLLVANTNCWNAYNAWGGVSNYSNHAEVVTLSFERPNPEAAPVAFSGGAYAPNHLTAAEIWLSTWLEDAGYRVDTCSDQDFHRGTPGPRGYRAVLLSTHPEYWSQTMAQRLADYVAGGGKVLYWGGNGVFRQVVFTADQTTMTTGSSTAWYCGNAWPAGPKPRTLLGVAYDHDHDLLYPARCGYVVTTPGHRFFAGTGLAAGDVVGLNGRNGGGACGWEVDTAVDFGEGNGGTAPGEQILAHGQLVSAQGYTGHMTYYENAAGGFVFAIGSISFGGSLPVDPRLQQIARNALDACLV